MRDVEKIVDDLVTRDLIGLAERIAHEHQVTLKEMLGEDRHRAASWARQALWAELYALGHWSYPRLGQLFGRDHSTIMAGVREHLQRTGRAA